MIRISSYRKKPGMDQICFGSWDVTEARALEGMIIRELGFGGSVTELTATRLVVETRIFQDLDTVVFEGSEEEMAFLVRVAAYHDLVTSDPDSRDVLVEKTADFLGDLPDGCRGNAFFITHLAPLFMGAATTSAALLMAAGITEVELLNRLKRIILKDLVAAVNIHRETGTSLLDIIEEM